MKAFNILFSLLVLFLPVACTDEVGDMSDDMIGFNVGCMDAATRCSSSSTVRLDGSPFFVYQEDIIDMPGTRTLETTTANLSSFYVTITKGSGAESVEEANVSFSGSQGGLYTSAEAIYWPMSDLNYHFYASNVETGETSSDYSRITCSNTTDVVYCYLASPTFRGVNTLNFQHVFGRVGSLSIDCSGLTDDSYTGIVTSASLTCPTAGVFDMKTGTWVSTTSSVPYTLNEANDKWVVPGTYVLSLDFQVVSGNEGFAGRHLVGEVLIGANKINNISVAVDDGAITDIPADPDPVVSWDAPVLSVSYAGIPVAGGSSNPVVTYTQTGHTRLGNTVTETQESGSASIVYSRNDAAAAFSLNTSTGVVSAESNRGVETVTYGPLTVTGFSYDIDDFDTNGDGKIDQSIPMGLTPDVQFLQSKSTVRTSTSSRSTSIRCTLTAHGQTVYADYPVTQVADAGVNNVVSITESSGAEYYCNYSWNGVNMSDGYLESVSGRLNLFDNVGSSSISYSTPTATLTYPGNSYAYNYSGNNISPSLSYSFVRYYDSVQSYDRSFTVSVTVNVAESGSSASSTCDVTQAGLPAQHTSTTINYGATVTWSVMEGSAPTGFTFNSTNGRIGVSSNQGTSGTWYDNLRINSFSYSPNPISNTGGNSSPTLSYSIDSHSGGRQQTDSKSMHVVATLNYGNGELVWSTTCNVQQAGDPGAAGTTTTQNNPTATKSYSFVGSHTGFTVNASTGVVTASSNNAANAEQRSSQVQVVVTSHGQSAFSTATVMQTGGENDPIIIDF